MNRGMSAEKESETQSS